MFGVPRRGFSITTASLNLWAVLVVAFLILPIIVVIPLSFNDSQFLSFPLKGLTLHWYAALFENPRWAKALLNSMVIAAISACLALVLGTAASFGLVFGRLRGKAAINAVLMAPMIVPVIVYAVGATAFFDLIRLRFGYVPVILAHVALASPFVIVAVSASLRKFDIRHYQAGLSLGASPLLSFRRIVVPAIMPGFISAGLLAFITSLDEVVTVIFLGGPDQRTIPREMLSGLNEQISPEIASASVLLVGIVLVAAALRGVATLRLRG